MRRIAEILDGDWPFKRGQGISRVDIEAEENEGIAYSDLAAGGRLLTRTSDDPSLCAQEIKSIQLVTEENQHRIKFRAALATLGWVTFGPVGAVVGAILPSDRTQVCFSCRLKAGPTFLATTSIEDFRGIIGFAEKTYPKRTYDEEDWVPPPEMPEELRRKLKDLGIDFD